MNDNETIADIIAEKRALADGLEHEMAKQKECKELMIAHRTAQAIIENSRREADRLEAAHKREIDEIKKLVADLQQQLPKPDPNWRDICAKCFENGATEPPDCKYYTEDGCISPIPDQHPLIQVGNVAKLREAAMIVYDVLEKLRPFSLCLRDVGRTREFNHLVCLAKNRLDAALAAPPRNCDRPECATTKAAQEVWRREDGGKTAHYAWLLAPHKEGGKDGNK